MTTEKLSVEVIECVQLVGIDPNAPADPLYRVEVAGRCFDFDTANTANLLVTAINDHARGLHDDLVKALHAIRRMDTRYTADIGDLDIHWEQQGDRYVQVDNTLYTEEPGPCARIAIATLAKAGAK